MTAPQGAPREAGREMDVRIAVEVMGLEVAPPGSEVMRFVRMGDTLNPANVPHYSTDIAAARLMEDEIERRSTPGSIEGRHVSYMLALAHEVGFSGFSTLGWTDLFRFQRATPLQRCRAAIAALPPHPTPEDPQ